MQSSVTRKPLISGGRAGRCASPRSFATSGLTNANLQYAAVGGPIAVPTRQCSPTYERAHNNRVAAPALRSQLQQAAASISSRYHALRSQRDGSAILNSSGNAKRGCASFDNENVYFENNNRNESVRDSLNYEGIVGDLGDRAHSTSRGEMSRVYEPAADNNSSGDSVKRLAKLLINLLSANQ